MAPEPVLLRDFTSEINTGTVAVPNWVEILGIQDGPVHKPSTKKKDVATSKSGGRNDNRVVGRGDTFTLKGQRYEDPVTGARNPGQEAVETLAATIGYNSVKQFRITSPGGVAMVFEASAEVKLFAGTKEDFAEWEAEIEVAGAIS
ncbi:MAG: phage tail tube protein [Thermoleophilia bacterium]